MTPEQLTKALSVPANIGGRIVQPSPLSPQIAPSILAELPPQQPEQIGSVALFQSMNPTSWILRLRTQFGECVLAVNDLDMAEARQLAQHYSDAIG